MKSIVFIHGFLLSGWIFTWMERYFKEKGYRCYRFNYSTRRNNIEQSAKDLQTWLKINQLDVCDFIGHSMGGLVCRAYFENQIDMGERSSVVCLGSPFNGSVVAQKLSKSKSGSKLLGVQTGSELAFGVNRWPDNSDLGIIAGNKNIGVGRLLGMPSERIGDGTVLLDETRIDGARDYIILPVTHSQMTFSKLVAEQADCFINYQRFNHNVES